MYGKTIVLCVLFAVCSARVTRDTTNQQTIDDFVKKARETIDSVGDQVSKALKENKLNIPTLEELQGLVTNASKTWAESASTLADKIDKEVKTLTDKSVTEHLQQSSKKLQETFDNLKKEVSEKAPEVAKLQKDVEDSFKVLVAEGQNIVNAVQPQANEIGKDLDQLLKKTVDEITTASKTLQDKIQKEIKKD